MTTSPPPPHEGVRGPVRPEPPAPGPAAARPVPPGPGPIGRPMPAPLVVPWHKRRGWQVGLSAAAVGVIALSGLVMLLVLGSTLGTPALVLAATAALLPLPVLVA